MNKFEASNGGTVGKFDNGRVYVTDFTEHRLSENAKTTQRTAYLEPEMVATLREFFRAERDEELGRWRFPDEPEWVVKEIDRDAFGWRRVECLNERTFEKTVFNLLGATGASAKHRAARAFFEAHPESKPWHEAKPGEVWELTFSEAGGGGAVALIFHKGKFRNPQYVSRVPLDDPTITAGRRIYPEVS